MKQNSPIDGSIKRFSTYPEHPEDKIPKSWLVDRIDKNATTEEKNRTFHPFFFNGILVANGNHHRKNAVW